MQPRVAAQPLPWDSHIATFPFPEGDTYQTPRGIHPLQGWSEWNEPLPRVVRSAQPWADLSIPFGENEELGRPSPVPSFPTGLISDFQAFLTERVIMKTLLD